MNVRIIATLYSCAMLSIGVGCSSDSSNSNPSNTNEGGMSVEANQPSSAGTSTSTDQPPTNAGQSSAGGAVTSGGTAAPTGGAPVGAGGAKANGGGGAAVVDQTLPTVCTPENAGICDCSTEENFTTYTWTVDGQQRCFTVYQPVRSTPLPAVIQMDCYAENNLEKGGCVPGSDLVNAADTYGFVAICATSTDGNWTFANDGVINDANPQPCNDEDSKDIVYMRGLFDTLGQLGESGVIDASRVYTAGFSQNAMFAMYTSFCFSDQLAGVWQGGSGLYVKGETDPLPRMEGACRASDFLAHKEQCINIAPCEECQYFPILPAATDPPLRACVMAYEDDSLFPTIQPMFTRLVDAGHNATALSFPNVGRGHSSPSLEWAWKMHCFQMTSACSQTCSDGLVACMAEPDEDPMPMMMNNNRPHPCGDGVCDPFEQGNPQICPRDCEQRPDGFDWCGDGLCDAFEIHNSSCAADCPDRERAMAVERLAQRYSQCMARDLGCTSGCTATQAMLLTVEQPVIE
ncbi:MAG: hypothetical protein VX589_05790 [Myxococcota bacterium]|nr:hypothetical protein [Myxococcota bacterium]